MTHLFLPNGRTAKFVNDEDLRSCPTPAVGVPYESSLQQLELEKNKSENLSTKRLQNRTQIRRDKATCKNKSGIPLENIENAMAKTVKFIKENYHFGRVSDKPDCWKEISKLKNQAEDTEIKNTVTKIVLHLETNGRILKVDGEADIDEHTSWKKLTKQSIRRCAMHLFRQQSLRQYWPEEW